MEKFTNGDWIAVHPEKNINNPIICGQKMGCYEIYSKQDSAWIAQVLDTQTKHGAANAALVRSAPEMYRALKRIQTILRSCPITVRQVIGAGDQAIDAAGLNPYCINEGADGEAPMMFDFIGYAIESAEALPEDEDQ